MYRLNKFEEKMNSKERVLTTFSHQEPDRVPINYLSNSGIDERLKKYFGLNVEDSEGLLDALGVDFRGVGASYKGPRLHAEILGRQVSQEWGIRTRWVKNESGGYFDYCDFPLKEADEEQVSLWPMPSPDNYDYSHVLSSCEKYKNYAISVGSPGLGDIINSNGFLRGTEQTLIDLITEDPTGMLLIDRRLDIHLEVTARTLEAAKGKIDFMWIGEDLGSQNAPLISPQLYRKVLRPRHQKFIDMAKSFNIPVMIHTCGSSSWVYEDFIEMGITIVDTLQPEAKDMSPKYLKSRYGNKLIFHGCISTAGPVAYGNIDEVTDNVKSTLEIMMPGGGYCMAPTHQLQDNSPTENVIAMYEATHKYGKYK